MSVYSDQKWQARSSQTVWPQSVWALDIKPGSPNDSHVLQTPMMSFAFSGKVHCYLPLLCSLNTTRGSTVYCNSATLDLVLKERVRSTGSNLQKSLKIEDFPVIKFTLRGYIIKYYYSINYTHLIVPCINGWSDFFFIEKYYSVPSSGLYLIQTTTKKGRLWLSFQMSASLQYYLKCIITKKKMTA